MTRVIFLGGKALGEKILKYLIEHDKVVLVVSNPSDEKPTWFPSIKPVARRYKIPYTVKNVNRLEKKLKKLRPDFLICAYYDKIVSDKILRIPKIASINIHMGLSSEYQGCYPTTFPIIDGKKYAGVTVHQMTAIVDGGDIYGFLKVKISRDETGKSLYDKCVSSGSRLFRILWPQIKNGKLLPQPLKPSKDLRIIKRNQFPSHEIKLNWPLRKIDRYIRALTFPPFPRPYFIINGKKFEIIFTKE